MYSIHISFLAIFYEVQKLSAKQCIIDNAMKVSYLYNQDYRKCMRQKLHESWLSAPRVCTLMWTEWIIEVWTVSCMHLATKCMPYYACNCKVRFNWCQYSAAHWLAFFCIVASLQKILQSIDYDCIHGVPVCLQWKQLQTAIVTGLKCNINEWKTIRNVT